MPVYLTLILGPILTLLHHPLLLEVFQQDLEFSQEKFKPLSVSSRHIRQESVKDLSQQNFLIQSVIRCAKMVTNSELLQEDPEDAGGWI